MFDVIIKNGIVVNHVEEYEADVAVLDGKIAAIGRNLGSAKREIDAKGNYVMPGCFDPHTHCGMFCDYIEDLEGESLGHLIGGTTTALQMICDKYSMPESVRLIRDPIPSHSYCDVGIYAALLTLDDLNYIEMLSSEGINAFKFLLAFAGKFSYQIGIDGVVVDPGYMYEAMKTIKKLGGMPMVHCENAQLGEWIEKGYGHANTVKCYDDSRPGLIEQIDLYTSCKIAEEVGVPLYQVHSSVPTNPQLVDEFRKRGNTVILETCPQYLILDYDGKDYRKGAAQRTLKEPFLCKIVPPIRSAENREGMRAQLAVGGFDVIGTDSANHKYAEKKRDGLFWNMPNGWSGVGTMLPMILDSCVNEGLLTMPDVVRMTSYTTAKVFGYAPKKGVMAPGADADLLIVDLNKTKVLKAGKTHHSNADWCLFEDWAVKGWPVMTMLRGEVAVENDEVLVKPGFGKYVPSKPAFVGYKGAKG